MVFFKTIYNVARWCASIIKSITCGRPLWVDSFAAATFDKSDCNLIKRILKHPNQWIYGDSIREYEAVFANYIGVKRAFSFFGGRVALSSILEAFDIGPEDEVIVPAYTCVVVPNAVRYRGAKLVYADIELDTLGLDSKQVRKLISEKTKAIIMQHLFGLVSRDMEEIIQLAKDKGIIVIEDCAHALGTTYKGRRLGTFGDAAFFSSEQSKVISTRMGGMAVSKHELINKKLESIQIKAEYPGTNEIRPLLKDLLWDYRCFKSKHSWWIYPWIKEYRCKYSIMSTTEQELEGKEPRNYGRRMPNALAMLGMRQLSKLEQLNVQRREEALNWDKWAAERGYQPFKVVPESEPIYLRYPVMVEPEMKKNGVWARQLGIELGVWFVSMEHPKQVECNFENASRAIECCINVPTLRRKRR